MPQSVYVVDPFIIKWLILHWSTYDTSTNTESFFKDNKPTKISYAKWLPTML